MKNKILSLLLCSTLAFGLCACGTEENTSDSVKTEDVESKIEDKDSTNNVAIGDVEEIVEDNNVSVEEELTFTNVSIGDYVNFGSYEQDCNFDNGPEPIEWEVLDINENGMLLVSKYVIDCQPYNVVYTDQITWENSSIRTWLNNDFYNSAFNEEERSMIVEAIIENKSEYEEDYTTSDKVFLLSRDEIINYSGDELVVLTQNNHEFVCSKKFRTTATEYAVYMTAENIEVDAKRYTEYGVDKYYGEEVIGTYGTSWITRSHCIAGEISGVTNVGAISEGLCEISCNAYNGVRPAIYVMQ